MKYFSALIKPASSLCNMRCKYCFYCDVSKNRETSSYGIMQLDTAKAIIKKVYNEIGEETTVTFAFQGGEPTLAGIDFFREFTAIATQTKPAYVGLNFAIQTNGYVIDDSWCDLFAEYDFLVGISLDGYERNHDLYRVDDSDKGTHSRIMQSIKLMETRKIKYNILTVVTSTLAKRPQELFKFYKNKGLEYLQFIPCIRSFDSNKHEKYDLTPRQYADFLKQLFTEWYNSLKSGCYISIRQFDNIVNMLRGIPAEQCGMMGSCSPQFVFEANGNVYPCDFYVLDQYCMGNICDSSIDQIIASPSVTEFLSSSKSVAKICTECKVYNICGGGCKRYRDFYFEEKGYCPYQDFLYATYDRFIAIADNL